MAKYMSKKDIQEYLEEGVEETGSIRGAFDYLLENEIRDIFEMDNLDVPKFKEVTIPFKGIKYTITITENGICESTNDHRIMYWKWTVKWPV